MHKMSLYPRSAPQLAAYLKENPVLRVMLASKDNLYTFNDYDGIRFTFTDKDGHLIHFPASGVINAKLEYNEDGFTRTMGKITAWYYYTGPKPWQDAKPDWKQKIEDWDGVFDGLKNFAD